MFEFVLMIPIWFYLLIYIEHKKTLYTFSYFLFIRIHTVFVFFLQKILWFGRFTASGSSDYLYGWFETDILVFAEWTFQATFKPDLTQSESYFIPDIYLMLFYILFIPFLTLLVVPQNWTWTCRTVRRLHAAPRRRPRRQRWRPPPASWPSRSNRMRVRCAAAPTPIRCQVTRS